VLLALALGEKESVEADDLKAAQTRVRALCRDIGREQEFQSCEGVWCSTCDFKEFCPAKARNPRPVPVTGRAGQLGFDFNR
jgi:hypothetical protein